MAAGSAHADPAPRGFRDHGRYFGARVGFNSAKIVGDNVNDSAVRSRTGLLIGAVAIFGLGPSFAISPAVEYSQKGARVPETSATIILDYIDVPVLLVAMAPIHPSARLKAFAGPSVGFNVKARVKAPAQSVDVSDRTKQFDPGIVFGAGADVLTGSGLLMVEMGYQLGLCTADDSPDEADIKNRAFFLRGGFAF